MARPRIRVLGAAFGAVPGSGAHQSSLRALARGVTGELDLVTLKTENLSHIERTESGRMLRVPIGGGLPSQQEERFRRAVARHLEAERYQVVHVLDPWGGLAATERRSMGDRFRLVYEPRTPPSPGGEARWSAAHGSLLRLADQVWVPSRAASEQALADGAKRTHVIPPSVDVSRFDWSDAPSNAPPRLLYLGALEPRRDVDGLLEAIRRVAEHRPIRVLLAGERDATRRGAVRDVLTEMGVADRVEVRGPPEYRLLPQIIAGADVCLAPAREGDAGLSLPEPLLEYLACYRPVVAADVPGVREWLEDEAHLLLYPPGDAAALADATLEMLRDAVLRERITEAGYQRVRRDLSAGAHRRAVRQRYEELVPGSQIVDAWSEPFEDSLSMGALSEYTVERLSLEPDLTTDDLESSTTDTLAPAPPVEIDDDPLPPPRPPGVRPEAITAADTPIAIDTHPALTLPDTDPGRD